MTPEQHARARQYLLVPENFASRHGRHELEARLAAIDEFLVRASPDTPPPASWFDADFYLTCRAGADPVHANPYLDFVLSGRFAGYYPSAQALERDAEAIVAAHPAGAGDYQRSIAAPSSMSETEAAGHFLRHGFHEGRSWVPDFDRAFVETNYPEYAETTVNSCVFAVLSLRRPWFFRNQEQASSQIQLLLDSEYFDEAYYRSQVPAIEGSASLHYLTKGARQRLDPSPGFSTSFYFDKYPDIARVEMNPLVHYILAGQSEGRITSANVAIERRPGGKPWDPDKPALLIASHEGSRTGAPIVGLRLAAHLSERYNVLVWLGRTGNLVDDFVAHCTTLLLGFPPPAELRLVVRNLLRDVALEFVILNSVETYPLLAVLSDERVGVVSLVHEFADYTRPVGRLSRMVSYSQFAVMPAGVVKESCERELEGFLLGPPANIVIRPQGGEDERSRPEVTPSETDRLRREILGARTSKVVFGAGSVMPRKGVDLFVDIARRVVLDHGDDAKFVWVGGGYQAESDLHYGVWLRERIRRSGVEEHVLMLPEQPHLEAYWAIADVFLLPSLLDPFPNVAIDAIAHGKPVVCFNGATGVAELQGDRAFGVVAVRFGDTVQAADAVSKLLREPAASDCSNDRVKALLSFEAYARDIERLGLRARDIVRKFVHDARDHIRAGLFDPQFFEAGLPFWLRHSESECVTPEISVLRYQRLASAGVHAAKPRPGFNDAVLSRSSLSSDDPYLGAFSSPPPPGWNEFMVLREATEDCDPDPNLPCLVHLHLYHAEAAPGFADRLARSELRADLLITTDTEAKRTELNAAFRGWDRGSVAVEVLENRGRNIGPLLHVLSSNAGSYELICHLHAKATHFLSKESVDAWNAFVLDHLVGSAACVRQIVQAFARDPELGLLFPDDPTIVGWTRNGPFAAEIVRTLGWTQPLPAHPEFPVGCMFWARCAALKTLVSAELTLDALPPEPVPYDGTVLHAIERLLPMACTESGYSWKTLHRPGLQRYSYGC